MLAACSSQKLPSWLQVHQIDIQQGNYIGQEEVERLRTGMNRAEVRRLLGSPVVVNRLRQERWDYFYYLKPGKAASQQRQISLFFDGDRLIQIDGDLDPPAPAATGQADQPQQHEE